MKYECWLVLKAALPLRAYILRLLFGKHEQYITTFNSGLAQRVAFSLRTISYYLIKPTSQIEPFVSFTSCDTRMDALFSRAIEAPTDQCLSEPLAGIVWMNST